MKSYSIRTLFARAAAIAAVLPVLASCDTLIYDGEGDCSVSYRIKFVYNRNLKFADAFASEVNAVSLYAFDGNGTLVWSKTESGEALAAKGYAMTADLKPGTYEMIAWCHGDNEGLEAVVGGGNAPQSPADLSCKLPRRYENGTPVVSDDLQRLYHGRSERIELPDTFGIVEREIPLTKNTNSIRVMLQHLNGKSISKDDFDFTITYADGLMAYDNSLLDDERLTYRAHTTRDTKAVIGEEAGGDAQTEVQGVFAELTMGRIMAGNDPILTVRDKTREGKEIIKIPLAQYALMVKGMYSKPLTNQEYLDYQDEYAMTFFLDDSNDWYMGAGIYINSWHVVPPQDEDLTGK
ncbi:MAG: FimB/Mfa2 family fimbrial subunit [Prevotella sp.]|nr:FimB/Mfa2 family fimbrial subunit [Prevotella sp.]